MVNFNDHFDVRALKIYCLYQIMYFILNDGNKKNPFHVLTDVSVYHTTKSKALITSLNRTGLCISYDEIKRHINSLGNYTAGSAEIQTPFPSHFSPHAFTTAAFDNFDHEEDTISGLHGSHYTVLVLFQDQNKLDIIMPELENTNRNKNRSFNNLLKCQEKRDFIKLNNDMHFNDFSVRTSKNLVTASMYTRNFNTDDLAWYLCRLDLENISTNLPLQYNEQPSVPSWSAFNSIFKDDNRPCQSVGFFTYFATSCHRI